MDKDAKIYVAGHRGLVGSALVRLLKARGFNDLLLRTHGELDLTDQAAVRAFLRAERPRFVLLAAARVGGILANSTYPADFIRENLQIQTNIIDASYRADVQKLLFLGSTCIYPKDAAQPMREDALLTGPLEPTNEWYAVAKIAGIKMCEAYRRQYGFSAISLMPSNLYGPGDNFDPQTSHVLAGLLRKFHDAKRTEAEKVVVWGTGRPRREFLHVDDLAEAALFLMDHYDAGPIVNVGVGSDISIRELATLIGQVVGYRGSVVFDPSKPDGTARKLVDTTTLGRLGWKPRIELRQGIEQTYEWFCDNVASEPVRRVVPPTTP